MYSAKRNIISSLILTVGFVIVNMYLTGQGIFNPAGPEFYWPTIISALLIFFPTMLFMPKMINKSINLLAPALEKQVVLPPEEGTILLEEGANHFKEKEAVGGKLFLTDGKLIFKSHKVNLQNHTEAFLLEKIENVNMVKDRFLTFNYEGKSHKFTVLKAEHWVKALSRFTY